MECGRSPAAAAAWCGDMRGGECCGGCECREDTDETGGEHWP